MAPQTTKTILIIGGSYAGIGLAQRLLKQNLAGTKLKVTIVNPTESFYFNVASPRIIAKPDFFKQEAYILSIPELFAKYGSDRFELVVGKATSIETGGKKSVTVEEKGSSNPKEVEYDYLVLASGSTTPSMTGSGSNSVRVPFKASGDDGLLTQIKDAQAIFKDARSVVIGGGGPVAVEFAGELAEAFATDKKQDTQITIISASDGVGVLPLLKPAAQVNAAKILKSKSVKIIPGTKVVQSTQDAPSKKWTITLSNGETLTADAYVAAIGVIPNNEYIPASFLNDEGFVRVDDQFRVLTSSPSSSDKAPAEGIYAIGDITQHSYRVVSRIEKQTKAIVANLKADILGGSNKRATGYDPEKESLILVVPVGQGQGTGQIGSWVLFSLIVALVKGKDFLTGRVKSILQV